LFSSPGGVYEKSSGFTREFEQLVLTGVVVDGEHAYGMAMHAKISELAAPRNVRLGAVYMTLGSIERQRPPPFMDVGPTPERGGRSKRYYELTARGARALKQSTTTAKRISDCRRKIAGTRKMETGPNLTEDQPPLFLEAMVTTLTPYDCRENVIGDLHRYYVATGRYGLKAVELVATPCEPAPAAFDIGFIAEEVAILGVSFSLAPSRASLIIAGASGFADCCCGMRITHPSQPVSGGSGRRGCLKMRQWRRLFIPGSGDDPQARRAGTANCRL